jgi:hypothetical protein
MHVFSLGDDGYITLFFASGISDGPGDDFAVFENGFFTPGGLFAEFAFVEVSSNGVDFAEFESHTVNSDPVPTSGVIDPSDYRNLAGDQPLDLGTGFDLAELAGDPLVQAALLDLDNVSYVRLTDVIGDGSTSDFFGNPVYDPYSTPFPTGGFDIEAVGVLHVVPEPALLPMLLSGIASLCALRRRRLHRQCNGPS